MELSNEGEREFLAVLQRHNGSAGTSVIRQETSMDASAVQYRFRTLEQKDLIEVDYDDDRTPDGVAAMRVAKLTDRARREIDRGLVAEAVVEQNDRERNIDELREALEDLEEKIERHVDEMEEMRSKLNENLVPMVLVNRDTLATIEQVIERSENISIGNLQVTSTKVAEFKRRDREFAE